VSEGQRPPRTARSTVAVVLVAFGLVTAILFPLVFAAYAGIFVGVLLVGVGVALLLSGRQPERRVNGG
jgi:putative Mn2+ efflux pump MntP